MIIVTRTAHPVEVTNSTEVTVQCEIFHLVDTLETEVAIVHAFTIDRIETLEKLESEILEIHSVIVTGIVLELIATTATRNETVRRIDLETRRETNTENSEV